VTEARLGPGAEFDRIRAIATALGSRGRALGDDCAVIPDEPGTLVASTDTSEEGVHFRLDWLTLEEAGYRAATSALSDLAAAGARAVGVFTALTAPRAATTADLVSFMNGVGDAAESVDGVVLGGDLTAGARWSATITVMGRAERVMSRRGARPGDVVYVTGRLGGARAALEAWLEGGAPDAASRAAFAHPSARIGAGRWLAAHGATAMLDLSDGLAGDAGHLAAASEVRIDLDLEAVPVHPSVVAPDRALFAAAGGEDYELLVCLPAGSAYETAMGVPLTRIGVAAEGQGVRLLRDGRAVALPASYNHFG